MSVEASIQARLHHAVLMLAALTASAACHEKAPLHARVVSAPKASAAAASQPPKPAPAESAASVAPAASVTPAPESEPEPERMVMGRRVFPEVAPWCQARRAEAYERLSEPPSECPEQILDAWVKRLRKTPTDDAASEGSLLLEIPALKQTIELGPDHTPLRCDGRAFPELSHTTFACSVSGETSMHTDLCSTRDALIVRHRTYGYFDPGTVREDRVELPCGTRLRFHSVKIRDAGWSGFGSACSRACYDGFDRCEDGCYRQHADGWGKLSPGGDSCLERCTTAQDACIERCQRKGQYP